MDGPTALGKHLACHVDERTGRWTPLHVAYTPNTLLYTWGHAAARCLGRGEREYRLSVMYLEFENVAGAAAIPTFDREDGIDYYSGLSAAPARDFLRVPLRPLPDIEVAAGFEAFLTPDLGNMCTFFAQSQGTQGVHGKPFADGANSKVVGVALAAAPVPGDYTQDVLFARSYYAANLQVPKTPAGQIGIIYPLTFK
jgi:hypothetical protein